MDIHEVTLLVIIQITLAHCLHLYNRVLCKVFLLDVLAYKLALAISCCDCGWCFSEDQLSLSGYCSPGYCGYLHSSIRFRYWGPELALCQGPCYSKTKCRDNNGSFPQWIVFCKWGSTVALIWNSSSIGALLIFMEYRKESGGWRARRHTKVTDFFKDYGFLLNQALMHLIVICTELWISPLYYFVNH